MISYKGLYVTVFWTLLALEVHITSKRIFLNTVLATKLEGVALLIINNAKPTLALWKFYSCANSHL